jgi:hypothetical protein
MGPVLARLAVKVTYIGDILEKTCYRSTPKKILTNSDVLLK